jgi:hypothetical protein
MNYSKIYQNIIDRAKNRIPEGYVERHHIIPRCLGGSDAEDNLVALYPEEHFLCHILLLKIYPKQSGLILAVNQMCRPIKSGRKKRKLYGWLKRRFVANQSQSQSGQGNSQFGTRWITDGNTAIKISVSDEIPEGWVLGRKIKPVKVNKRNMKKISEEDALALLKDYESGLPMSLLLKKYNRKSEQSVTTFLRKRFPNRKKFLPKSRIPL